MHLVCPQQTCVKTDKWVPRTSAECWQLHKSDAMTGRMLLKNVNQQTMARYWLHYLVTARIPSRPPVPSALVDLTLNLSPKRQRSGLSDSNRSTHSRLDGTSQQRELSLLTVTEQSHPQKQHLFCQSPWPLRPTHGRNVSCKGQRSGARQRHGQPFHGPLVNAGRGPACKTAR